MNNYVAGKPCERYGVFTPCEDFRGSRPCPTSPGRWPEFRIRSPREISRPVALSRAAKVMARGGARSRGESHFTGRARFVRGRVTPHRKGSAHRVALFHCMTAPLNQALNAIMKTLFTAEAIPKGGRSETNQTPNGCRTSHSGNSEEITRAKDIFTKAGAQDICTTGEASTPKESKAASRAAHPAKETHPGTRL
jgi:hypothetical protein